MKPLTIIAGPCVVEDEDILICIADKLHRLQLKYKFDLIFKASYRKANRTHGNAFQGIGDEDALRYLQRVRQMFGLRVTTDIHSAREAEMVAVYDVDVIQIPAFLCRQTDILHAAAATGKMINIKKGQFATADMMDAAIDKVALIQRDYGLTPNNVMVTERGNTFGYHDVVIDMRNITWLLELGVSVIVDVTHTNGKDWTLSERLGNAAIGAGTDGLFFETHPDPYHAKSDAGNMIPLEEVEDMIKVWMKLKKAIGV